MGRRKTLLASARSTMTTWSRSLIRSRTQINRSDSSVSVYEAGTGLVGYFSHKNISTSTCEEDRDVVSVRAYVINGYGVASTYLE